MMRPFTCVCLLLAAVSGLYLYQTKHRAALLDREIAQLRKGAEAARARTGVLQAEWALVTERDRLGELAQRFLELKPLAPTQFVAMADLAARLPAPAAATPPASADTPAEPAPAEPQPVPVASAPPTATPAMPRAVASATPAPRLAAVAATHGASHASPAPASRGRQMASAQTSAPRSFTGVDAGPRTVRAPAAAAPAPIMASALGGMRTALPPPVPFAAAAPSPQPNYWTGH